MSDTRAEIKIESEKKERERIKRKVMVVMGRKWGWVKQVTGRKRITNFTPYSISVSQTRSVCWSLLLHMCTVFLFNGCLHMHNMGAAHRKRMWELIMDSTKGTPRTLPSC